MKQNISTSFENERLTWAKISRFIALPFQPTRLTTYLAVKRFEEVPIDVLLKDGLKIANNYFNKYNIDFLFGAIKKNKVFHKFEPEKLFYRLNIYPSHSGSFFIKLTKQKELGLYDINFNYCADYDLFFRMIKKNFKGMCTKKNEVIAKFDMHGMSSKISIFKSYYYEMKVRLKNGQNLIYLIFLYILKVLNYFRNRFI